MCYILKENIQVLYNGGDEMIIAVCGAISSGKTTLAKKICKLFDFEYVPCRRQELTFLEKFFNDIPNNFLKTQVSFLVSKILEIEDKKDKNIVIDRSLYEDINVFAQLWMDLYPINENEQYLYKSLSKYLCTTIPVPSVYLVCRGEWQTLCSRFEQRQRRKYEEDYPDDFLHQVYERYRRIEYPKDAYVIEIDTDKVDVRLDSVVIDIMNFTFNSMKEGDYKQLSLFDDDDDDGDEGEGKVTENYYKIIQRPNDKTFNLVEYSLIKKRIYLAAPFTEFATEEPINNDNQIALDIDTKREYNVLPQKYQRYLNKLKKTLSCDNEYDVILPHKDENNWGKTYKTSEQIVSAMIDNMLNCDLIVALVSNSVGVHMEIAMMSVQKKPMVLIVLDNLSSGFYADGFVRQDNVMVIHVDSLEEVNKAIEQEKILLFIREQLEDEEMDTE